MYYTSVLIFLGQGVNFYHKNPKNVSEQIPFLQLLHSVILVKVFILSNNYLLFKRSVLTCSEWLDYIKLCLSKILVKKRNSMYKHLIIKTLSCEMSRKPSKCCWRWSLFVSLKKLICLLMLSRKYAKLSISRAIFCCIMYVSLSLTPHKATLCHIISISAGMELKYLPWSGTMVMQGNPLILFRYLLILNIYL